MCFYTVKPSVEVENPVVMQAVDKQVTLQCLVEASPKSLNTWQRGKSALGKYPAFNCRP